MKRVVVIGAGSSGLAAIKSCVEEGFQVICYELTNHVGGIWKFREDLDEDTSSIFRSVVLNASKEMMAYSDFQPPIEFPTYPRHVEWYQYLEQYCEHFDLRKHVRFYHKVVEVIRAEDYESTGRWKVTVCDIQNGNSSDTHYFDMVMICSGHHVYPIMPSIPGLEKFGGRIIHSKEYKRPDIFREQNVLVIGFGNSALDIANDLCSSTKQVYLSTRRKGWVIPKILEGGKISIDEFYRRSFQLRYRYLPISWLLAKYERMLNSVFDHEFFGFKPKHNAAAQRPVVNDFLHINLLNGTVRQKNGITDFQKSGVMFEGEDSTTEVDSVILATGFRSFYPYLKGMEDVDKYMDAMYKLVIPANLKFNSLAIIGMIDPNLSVQVCAEMQSRWAAGVFSGKVKLPPKEQMLKEARAIQDMLPKVTYEGFTQKTNTNGPPYLDDLASMLGAKPNLFRYCFTDPKLFWGLFAGPLVPYQFRVQGPHAWAGARRAILDAEERQTYVLRQNRDPSDSKKNGKPLTIFAFSVILGMGILWQVRGRISSLLQNYEILSV